MGGDLLVDLDPDSVVGNPQEASVVKSMDIAAQKPSISRAVMPLAPITAMAMSGVERGIDVAPSNDASTTGRNEESISESLLLGPGRYKSKPLCALTQAIVRSRGELIAFLRCTPERIAGFAFLGIIASEFLVEPVSATSSFRSHD